jgi:hypothetical protein
MLDIGRLAYRVWCGKVRNNACRALRCYEKLASPHDAFTDLNLTSIVDPDKVLPCMLHYFAIATNNQITDGAGDNSANLRFRRHGIVGITRYSKRSGCGSR